MEALLYNPVYNALLTGDRHFALGNAQVKYFPEAVSPYVGFDYKYEEGFHQLRDLLPQGRQILFARPEPLLQIPDGWQLRHAIPGLQFVHKANLDEGLSFEALQPLASEHIPQMIALTRRTRPGPFDSRTIEFGGYHGIFKNGELVAMTGQRLHAGPYTEVSAVCTHPNHLGKGYATLLLKHQLQLIVHQGQQPFLHVRADNERAIAVYERLGFELSRPMNFYFVVRD